MANAETGVDVLKGQLTHPEDNHYEAVKLKRKVV